MGYLESSSHLEQTKFDKCAKSCIINLVNNKEIIMTQHEQIVAAYENYLAENAKFTDKGVKAAAARARKA